MIVATTRDKKIIFISEYEHGAGKKLLTFPSGHIKKGEDPVDAARRELLEEVGYGKGNFSLLGSLYEYPSKDLHQLVVDRAEETKSQCCFGVANFVRIAVNKLELQNKFQVCQH